MSRAHRSTAALVAAAGVLLACAGCAPATDPIERLGRRTVQKMVPGLPGPAARLLRGTEHPDASAADGRRRGTRHPARTFP